MSQQDFDQLLQKYLSGKYSTQEETAVLEWYNRLINASKIEISSIDKDVLESRLWSKISENITASEIETEGTFVKFPTKIIYRIAIAASFIGAITLGLFFLNAKQNGTTASNSNQATPANIPAGYLFVNNDDKLEKLVPLTDGSIVKLQPQSAVYYPQQFNGKTREVYLTGTAFFKVSHNPTKHFIVHSNGLATEVLGTSFWIVGNADTHKIEVSVVTGKVSVYEQGKKVATSGLSQPSGVILTPNQRATFNEINNQFITALVEKPMPLNVLENLADTGNFIFKEATVGKVLSELKKAYGIEISSENKELENCHFTGDITKQDLYKKLDIICQSIQSSYELKGTSILIKGKGCK